MEILWLILDSNGDPVTGGSASTAFTLRRGADGFLYDFDDATFKAAGWTSATQALTEEDAVNLPGWYTLTIDVTDFDDGWYQGNGVYSVTPSYSNQEFAIYNGADVGRFNPYYLVHNQAGVVTPVVIPAPVASDTCVIYALCYDETGATPLASVKASAKITHLPYYGGSKYHTGDEIAGSFSSGLQSWEIVQGATVLVKIEEVGILGHIVIPASANADIYTLL